MARDVCSFFHVTFAFRFSPFIVPSSYHGDCCCEEVAIFLFGKHQGTKKELEVESRLVKKNDCVESKKKEDR